MIVPTSVSSAVGLDLVDETAPPLTLVASMTYDQSDPFAVEAVFEIGEGQPVRWIFARELLNDGLLIGGGDGDVVVWPETGYDGADLLMLRLSSPDGSAQLAARASDVLAFLTATYELVPRGSESDFIDVDAAISALLAG